MVTPFSSGDGPTPTVRPTRVATVPTPYGIIRPTPTPSACVCRLRCGGGGGGKSRSLESCAAPLQAGVFVIQYYLVKLSTDTGWERGNSVLVAVDASHLRSVQCAAHH